MKPPSLSYAGQTSSGSVVTLFGLALVLTGVNALKPMSIDDTIFYAYARQIAEAPLDPYGFQVFWEVQPVSALDLFAPVGMPYWWALGLRVVGDSPFWWKLWMFPYAVLLVWALRELIARWVGRAETPLLAMVVLSPSILPAFNLMIDVPALSLSLAALAVFARGCESGRTTNAVLAGLLAALALETKFTAFAPAAAIALHALLQRQWRLLAVFAGVCGGAFALAETALYLQYGTSHFLRSLEIPPQAVRYNTPAGWAVGWIALAGALAGPLAILGSARFLPGRAWGRGAIALCALPFLLIAVGERPRDSVPFGPTQLGAGDLELAIFFVSGCVIALVLLAAMSRDLLDALPGLERTHAFLLGWFAIELALCFAVSPFHASRRLIGPIVAGTLLLAHGAACRGQPRDVFVRAAAFSAALGLLFATADVLDARTRQGMHDRIAAELGALGHDPARETVWFTGHWGFQFEAERRGYRAIMAGHSDVARGDWLLLPNRSSAQPKPAIALGPALARIEVGHGFPLSTIPSAYMAAVAIRRQPLAQNRVTIHRIEASGRVPLRLRRPGS